MPSANATAASAVTASVPAPTTNRGRRPISLGRLFTRPSVLLVSTSPLSPLGDTSLLRLGEEATPRQEQTSNADERQDEEPYEVRREDEQAKPEDGQEPQRPPRPPLAAPERHEDEDEGQDHPGVHFVGPFASGVCRIGLHRIRMFRVDHHSRLFLIVIIVREAPPAK